MTLYVVIIGLGQRGLGYLKYLARQPVSGIQVIGALELQPKRRKHAKTLYPELKIVSGWYDKDRNPVFLECNTVFVCTLLPIRVVVLRKLPPNVRHILMEKPIALPRQVELVSSLVVNRTVHVPLVLRFTELYRSLRRVIRVYPARLSKVHYQLDLNRIHGISYVRRRHAEGFLQNKVCHDLDLLCFVMNTSITTSINVTVTTESVTQEPEGRATHCSQCSETRCAYRFNPRKNNYVLVTDKTNLRGHDSCVYPLITKQPLVTGYKLTFGMEGVPVCLEVALFTDQSNRTINLHWCDGHQVVTNYHDRTIIDVKGAELYNFQSRKYIGHQNGDISFLHQMRLDAQKAQHTLFQQSKNLVQIIDTALRSSPLNH